MSLSAISPSRVGGPPPVADDWPDSPYGSLIGRGPRTFKKQPVLMLDAEELAKAHLAIAMGGAEIMETMPDPVEAPRPRPPAMLLGLAPMGAEDDDDLSAYSAASAELAAAEMAAAELTADWAAGAADEEWDEPAEEEADEQIWVPEDEPDDVLADEEPSADAGFTFTPAPPAERPAPKRPPAVAAEPAPPSIEEQMQRMRERLASRAAAPVAASPPVAISPPVAVPAPVVAPPPVNGVVASAVAERRVPTIERLEIDDWSQGESLKGFIPPQEADLAAPAPTPPPTPPSAPLARVPMPEPAAQPAPIEQAVASAATPPAVPAPAEPVPATQVPAAFDPWAAVLPPTHAPIPEPIPGPIPGPVNVSDDPLDLDAAMMAGEDELDAWREHVTPVARRASPIRERLRASLAQDPLAHPESDDAAPSLLARLWGWLRGRL